jgi:hypothetical protein
VRRRSKWLIESAALDECLELQEHLQNLAAIVAGWRGSLRRAVAGWLRCCRGATDWQETLTERDLRLAVCLR